jgi:hypothetical protein
VLSPAHARSRYDVCHCHCAAVLLRVCDPLTWTDALLLPPRGRGARRTSSGAQANSLPQFKRLVYPDKLRTRRERRGNTEQWFPFRRVLQRWVRPIWDPNYAAADSIV